jgi:uncharacterized membrane protein
MTTIKSVCSVIALFFISTFAHSIPVDVVPEEESLSQSSVVPKERNWVMLENPISSDYQLSASSGKIQTPFGIFDPLAEDPPLGQWQAIGLQRPYDARLHIVQSISPDLFELQNELISIGIEIIDHIPDDSVVISLPEEASDSEISRVQNLSQVRWAGPMPSTWKVSKSLLALTQYGDSLIDLDVTPSPANSPQDLASLDALLNDLEGIEHETSQCDAHLCQIKSAKPSLITSLASDHRITRVEPGPVLSIQNSNASIISGVDLARDISGANLTGLGEVIGISDTGLDADHGDFDGRLRSPIFNLFGPDNSGADSNSGHGTHVTSTLLGDGSGDSNSTGIVPEATFHFYQLEVDSSGILARWGSLYEMFEHSLSNDAYIHTNSWGSESLVGDYTSDSRSIDWFTNDYPEFLVIFSAGDMGVSGVTSPSTAKNALSVGASTTGAFGSEAIGQISNESSSGPTSDGRIKPDLVAPGVMICSARAQEADLATGGNCSNSMHPDGSTPMYMTLNGSSMATSVVAGASAMAREFLREEVGITTPGSDLIRALLVNGAEDIGEQDVPNSREGWGQLNISNSLLPKSNGVNLSVFYDQERQLMPGHSFIYTFEVSGSSGIDVTLAWNDIEGSASAAQNASRLVNNLDLVVTSPTGEIYNGNNFANGISQTTQFSDQLNNLERVRLPSSQSGLWSVQVGHAGGFVQDFSLVLAADAEERQEADLTVVSNSIFTSENSPLKGDTISMQLSWINQAAAPTGDYSISLRDITDGVEIGTYSMPSLVGGGIETFSIYHSFSTTGTHIVRLTLDHFSEVVELNDENSGTNNNVYDLELDVTEIGVRITPLLADGSHPSDFQELESAKHQNIDPSLVSWAEFQLELLNEGTSEITVELSTSAVQIIDESGIMNTPQDEWSRSLSESGPWVLSPFGEEGDRVVISLNLTDEDADLESRFALPGLFVTDVTLRDKMSPTIFHSIRLSVDIDRVEGLFTIPAGTESLGSEPNTFALFTLSVKNIGNGPTEYSISCETSDRWIVHVGSSQSSEITIGPLSRLQFVPVQIRVKVPPASSGLSAGDTNQVTCVTTSVNDPTLFTIETAEVEVLESTEFLTQISDSDGIEFGPAAISESRAVLNGETVTTVLSISNRGNIPLDFQVRALSSSNTWPIQVYLFDEEPPSGQESNAELVVEPGEESKVIVRTIVPLAAERGDRNTITVKTTLGDTVVTNATVLEVREITTLDVQSEAGFSIALGRDGNSNIFLHNSGNVPLLIDLTMGTLPEGWSGGFLTGKTFTMDMNRDSIITIGLQLPSGTPVGTLSEKVPVIIESTSPSLSKETITVEMGVSVLPSVWIDVQSDSSNLQGVSEGEESTFSLEVHNRGNSPSGVILDYGDLDGWSVVFEPSSIEELGPGEYAEISVTVKPRKSAEDGLNQLLIFANSTSEGDQATVTPASLIVDISKAKSSNSGGISGIFEALGLPAWTIAIVFFAVLMGTLSFGIRARQEFQPVGSEEELIPRGSALQAGTKEERRAAALDTSTTGDVVTGEVSTLEIEDALQSTVPTLPTHQVPEGALPLPLTGLPDGWTMDQWVAYGHIWWEQNGP